jgi:YfiH family protein
LPELLTAALPGAVGGFTTRAGGVSDPPYDSLNLALHVGDDPDAVFANRAAARLSVAPTAFPEQVHGSRVAVAVAPGGLTEWPDGAGCDAVVTAVDGLPIGVLVADCMPVLLVDAAAEVVGAAHAGRRGLVAGVLRATLDAMTGLGAAPERIRAVIGPAICGRCYEVPAELRDEVDAAVPGTACETTAGTPGLDLPAGARRVLRDAGVSATSVGICTAEDPRFFSYRRDGVTGRFAGLVMLPAHE